MLPFVHHPHIMSRFQKAIWEIKFIMQFGKDELDILLQIRSLVGFQFFITTMIVEICWHIIYCLGLRHSVAQRFAFAGHFVGLIWNWWWRWGAAVVKFSAFGFVQWFCIYVHLLQWQGHSTQHIQKLTCLLTSPFAQDYLDTSMPKTGEDVEKEGSQEGSGQEVEEPWWEVCHCAAEGYCPLQDPLQLQVDAMVLEDEVTEHNYADQAAALMRDIKRHEHGFPDTLGATPKSKPVPKAKRAPKVKAACKKSKPKPKACSAKSKAKSRKAKTPKKSKGSKGKQQSKEVGHSPFKDRMVLNKKLHSATW